MANLTPRRLSKKELRRQIPAKTSFTSPFNLQWSPLPQGDMQFILKTLKDKLVSTGLEKKEGTVFRPWKKKKKAKKPPAASETIPPASGKAQVQDRPTATNGWTDIAARRQLAIGINEVTKALERNQLKLALVCKSVKPQHMTAHLIGLSATRHVPACQVPRLSECVSEPLGLKSVLALGFRRCASEGDGVFTDTVDAIVPRVPSLDVAWLRGGEPGVTSEGPVETEEEHGETRAKKRKLESESEEVVAQSAPAVLQPLKVKKIIANSNRSKERKQKQKKKKA